MSPPQKLLRGVREGVKAGRGTGSGRGKRGRGQGAAGGNEKCRNWQAVKTFIKKKRRRRRRKCDSEHLIGGSNTDGVRGVIPAGATLQRRISSTKQANDRFK